jgi:hypothetical protein
VWLKEGESLGAYKSILFGCRGLVWLPTLKVLIPFEEINVHLKVKPDWYVEKINPYGN